VRLRLGEPAGLGGPQGQAGWDSKVKLCLHHNFVCPLKTNYGDLGSDNLLGKCVVNTATLNKQGTSSLDMHVW